jgi:hypothetical protein
MVGRLLVGLLTTVSITVGTVAPAMADVLQMKRDSVLRELTREQIAKQRLACASGSASATVATIRSVGIRTLSAGAYCVTVLTRAGRDGTLRYVQDTRTNQLTSAIAFDSGFVGGYLKREALPPDAPTMAVLLPIADRCLDQSESNTKLCSSVGYMLALRAARGEVVPVS